MFAAFVHIFVVGGVDLDVVVVVVVVIIIIFVATVTSVCACSSCVQFVLSYNITLYLQY